MYILWLQKVIVLEYEAADVEYLFFYFFISNCLERGRLVRAFPLTNERQGLFSICIVQMSGGGVSGVCEMTNQGQTARDMSQSHSTQRLGPSV